MNKSVIYYIFNKNSLYELLCIAEVEGHIIVEFEFQVYSSVYLFFH